MTSKNIYKSTLFILLIVLGLLQYFHIDVDISIKKIDSANAESGQKIELSGDADKEESKPYGAVIGTYNIGKGKFNVVSIPEYKYNIQKKYGLTDESRYIIHTKNTLECGDENGFCLGSNHADAGPFQINQIHETKVRAYCKKNGYKDYETCPHTYSEYLVKKGKEAYNNSMKSGDWTTTIAIRNTLYNFQIGWMIPRIIRFDRTFCKGTIGVRRMYCQAILHNGSSRKEYYGNKAVKSFNILNNYYLTK